ncbi:MAG: HAMP domain-containing histidine kinase [Lentisphaerae bacterium]|nr:HAMP domain-containing histidine kinase [Lentisphaerota bacterium]
MSWNKEGSRRISLKTRLALGYGILFLLSCSIIFALAGYLLVAQVNKSGDLSLQQIAARTRGIYVLGARYDRLDDLQPEESYPDFDRFFLENHFPGAEILFVNHVTDSLGGRDYYTAYFCFEGDYYEFRVRDENSFFSQKINIQTNQPNLRSYISRIILARGQDNLRMAILNKDGSNYLANAGKRNPAGKKRQPPSWQQHRTAPYENGNFRYLYFPFPDGRTVVIGRRITERDELVRRYVFIFCGILLAATFAGMCIAWLISRRFIRGIQKTTLAMNRISSGFRDYSYRISDLSENDWEIRDLMQTFNAMNERTEHLLSELKMMSDNVAHDLRTPLTRISGTVEMLLTDRNLDESVRTVFVSIAEETARLKTLVNTLMDISHTSSRPDELHKEVLDLCEQLRDFCEFMQPAFEEKGLQFQLDLPDLPLRIRADKSKFQRVVSNLLENALKFTERGSVMVKAADTPDGILFQVSDTGCGISEEDCKHIYERFFRSDSSRHLQGNGLGLALVQAIVKAHGWTITVDSKPGRGSVFSVLIRDSESDKPGTPPGLSAAT